MSQARFDKFTERARKVLTLAQEEATRLNHNYIGTEHLLLGLVREGEGVAAKILANLGVEVNRVRDEVIFIIGRGDRMLVGEIGLTPRAKKVIELAVDEARRLGHHYIGTEHLLLGLVREGEGIAAGVLEKLGLDLDKVRTQTIQVLSQSNAPRPAGAEAQSQAQVQVQHEYNVPAYIHGPRQEGLEPPGAPVRWEYLALRVAYPDPAAGGVAMGVVGLDEAAEAREAVEVRDVPIHEAAEAREAVEVRDVPIHEALETLGSYGWELVAIDTAGREGGTAGSHYVFRRPL